MEAKEKAQELVDKFSDKANEFKEPTTYDYDKECALICVDEMINQFTSKCCESANVRYWNKVKEEINNL